MQPRYREHGETLQQLPVRERVFAFGNLSLRFTCTLTLRVFFCGLQ